ncbi:MAG: hypothetical protein JNM85_07980 [Chthonomonas sp.]|nr:hypothetical protein [Chthonomonas sp.]
MNSLHRVLVLASLVGCSVTAMGWNKDKPSDVDVIPEASQERLAQEQAMNQTVGEVGVVPKRIEARPDVPWTTDNDGDGASDVANANVQAAETLKVAAKPVAKPKSTPTPWFAGLLLAAGVGAAVSLKRYADRNMPSYDAVKLAAKRKSKKDSN